MPHPHPVPDAPWATTRPDPRRTFGSPGNPSPGNHSPSNHSRLGRHRLLALTAGLLLASPLLGVPAHAAAADPGYSLTALRFTVPVDGGPEPTCTVDADLYQPDGVSAANPAPALLTTNGFGGSKDDSGTAAVAADFAARGYVVLAYSGLGFGQSSCPISLDDPAIDGKAASALIDFLAGTRAADDGTRIDDVVLDGPNDPRVGMIGGSYGGAVQLATASVDHRVDAIVPMVTWNDLSYSLDPNSTDQAATPQDPDAVTTTTPGVYKSSWTNAFFAIGQLGGLADLTADLTRLHPGCIDFAAQACATKSLLDSGDYPAGTTAADLAYVRSVSPVSYLSRVTTPTLLVQGEDDTLFDLNEAAASYRTLQAQGTPVAMIWQAAGHSGGDTSPADGELNTADGNFETSYVGQRILAWFDRYLRHQDVDTGPGFAYYRDWMPVGQTYGTAADYPAATGGLTLYPSADGSLVSDRQSVVTGTRSYVNAPLLATSHSGSPLDGSLGTLAPQPFDTPGTYLGYTSAPLTADTDVAGVPKATLQVSAPVAQARQSAADPAGDLVLFVKLYDVAPDGSQTLVNRLVAPVRVPDAGKPFTVSLPGIVHRYPAGDRIRLVIAASDDSFYGNQGVVPVSLASSPTAPDAVTLPTVP